MSASDGATLFARLSASEPEELEAQGWVRRVVGAGEPVCREGDRADALYVVVDGTLDVQVDARSTDTLGVGATIGEASVFFRDELRRATITATSKSTLLKLHRSRLRELRARGDGVYDWLLVGALGDSWRRIEQRDRDIVTVAPGTSDAPVSRKPGVLQRLWKRMRESEREPPPAIDALSAIPTLSQADPQLLMPLVSVMTPRLVEAEHALFFQGDKEPSLYLVASGELAIIRQTTDGKARELTRSGPGAFVGVGAFLTGQPRSASAVAHGECWVFGVAPHALESLPFFSRRLLQEAVLAAVRLQLAEANELMGALQLDFDGDDVRGVGSRKTARDP